MDRRSFLGLATVATGSALLVRDWPGSGDFASAAPIQRSYPSGVIWQLPNLSSDIAWTVDDGASPKALRNYIDFAQNTGTRMTFFVVKNISSWTTEKKHLLPLVETGQIQLAVHTTSHPNLMKLSNSSITRELRECADFIHSEYGVKPSPTFRPPYGFYDDRVLKVAADAGFRTCVMWYGSLGDSTPITPKHRLQLASKWMNGGRIVIAHANEVISPADLLKIRKLIDSRGLHTVTLNDIWRP